MIGRRALVTAAIGGAGTVLAAAGGAFAAEPSAAAAGQPADFQQATVACAAVAHGGQAAITVTDTDASGSLARIAVFPAGTPTTNVPARTTTAGTVTFQVPWVEGAGWDVHVSLAGGFADQVVKTVMIPRRSCAAVRATRSAAAAAAAKGGIVSPVAPAALAESGGGDSAGFLAILAGVMVAAGGGALYAVRRLARRG
ncbi:hypothetical protein [Phaeacidiphilus oryzae]|uniref:hypothetical protein n=1 Tax=Phaeacidiphilus oryzae TaxID=348818 RepID=UPI00055ACC4A|nr:hypothetical protein [Phaeacidiphilus oryzae]